MSSGGRSRRRELVEEAYDLQVKAGLMASRIHFPFQSSLSLSSLVHCVCVCVRACVRAILPKFFILLSFFISL